MPYGLFFNALILSILGFFLVIVISEILDAMCSFVLV